MPFFFFLRSSRADLGSAEKHKISLVCVKVTNCPSGWGTLILIGKKDMRHLLFLEVLPSLSCLLSLKCSDKNAFLFDSGRFFSVQF